MSKIITNQLSKNTSKTNLTNINNNPKKKTINYQEINSLKILLKPEIREAKGQDLVNTYIKLLEKQYETIIESSINTSELIKANKNNEIFQKVLNKAKNKLNQRKQSKSKKDYSLSNKSISINKISTSKSSFNASPIKKIKKNGDNGNNSIKNCDLNNNKNKNVYWQDYDFVKNDYTRKPSKRKNNKNNKNKSNSSSLDIKSKYNLNNNIYNKNQQLENYYLYLLNRRQKICENKETDEEKQNEKIEVDIMRKILGEIYNEDEKIKIKLEDNNLPDFYKRFIIQNEIKKDNLFFQKFKLNYDESRKLKGPKLCNSSRLICKYVLNYEPIYKRIDKIMKTKNNNLDLIKKRIDRKKFVKEKSKKKSDFRDTEEWLKSMDDWYHKKMKKIFEKKEEIEKNDPSKKECRFKPEINDNAHCKKEDQRLTCSDRLYLEYFTLRDKKISMLEEEFQNFSFQPNVSSYKKIK